MKRQLLLLLTLALSSTMMAQYDTLRIDSIQYVAPSDLANCVDLSRYDGDTVVLTGIALVDGDAYGSTSHNIQISQYAWPTPFGGIRFRQGDPNAQYNVNILDIKQGDSVIAVGFLSQYQGETQFEPLETNNSIKILKRNIAVSDTVLSVGDLNDATRNNNLRDGEQWESAYVTIEDVEVVSVDPFLGNRVSFVVADQAGNRINISDHFKAQRTSAYTFTDSKGRTFTGDFVPPAVGDKFTSLSGIIIHSKNNCPGETGRGYELQPFEKSHYKYGPSAPRISNIKRSHAVPSSSQAVTITADIIDLDGSVTAAELYYNTGTDRFDVNFTMVAMTNTTGNTYEATIPAQGNGTFVRFYLKAQDDSSNTTQLPSSNVTESTYSYRVRDNGLGIYDVQFTPFPSGDSPFLGEEVTVTGVVTSSGKSDDLSVIHIQQEGLIGGWAGVMLTNPGTTFNRGQKIEVTGTVQEAFGNTAISVTSVSDQGTGTINPTYIEPDTFTTYDFDRNEKWESVLVGLINADAGLGNGRIHIVDTNADSGGGNNYAEYRVGRDPFDPGSGCRVLAGRDGLSSTAVSYVNSSSFVQDPYPITKVLVSDTMNMDTLLGIMTYSFSNMKILPRDNDDFVGINVGGPGDTNTAVIEVAELGASILLYPNPASSEVNVSLEGFTGALQMNFTDLNGRTVRTIEVQGTATRVDLEGLNKGMYFISFRSEDGNHIATERLVVR
jgi:hypothetical protein